MIFIYWLDCIESLTLNVDIFFSRCDSFRDDVFLWLSGCPGQLLSLHHVVSCLSSSVSWGKHLVISCTHLCEIVSQRNCIIHHSDLFLCDKTIIHFFSLTVEFLLFILFQIYSSKFIWIHFCMNFFNYYFVFWQLRI